MLTGVHGCLEIAAFVSDAVRWIYYPRTPTRYRVVWR